MNGPAYRDIRHIDCAHNSETSVEITPALLRLRDELIKQDSRSSQCARDNEIFSSPSIADYYSLAIDAHLRECISSNNTTTTTTHIVLLLRISLLARDLHRFADLLRLQLDIIMVIMITTIIIIIKIIIIMIIAILINYSRFAVMR